jgi:para-nitrobenzyl esterase
MNSRANSTILLVLSLAAICAVTLGSAVNAAADKRGNYPIIHTESGPLNGIIGSGVKEYLGIPYAAPPVGARRWTPPQAFGKWKGLFQATQFGNYCTQPFFGTEVGSEDCLYLNVYTPSEQKYQKKDKGLPVMVWIHGGGLVTGGGAAYDPTRMIQQSGVIVVTINYRLGLFGFFAHPAIDSEGHLNGNYGLMDQQFALNWVQNNIAAFGGDPDRVTIFGESAGGQSVYANLASPTAAGLFQRAISESGSYVEFQDYFDYIVTTAIAETTGTANVPAGNAIANSVGCGLMATALCLRGVSAWTLVGASPGTLYPFVDGTILTQTPGAAFASGDFNKVPVITGGNHDEWRYSVALQYDLTGNPLVDEAEYEAATDALYPVIGPTLYTTLYPLLNYQYPGEALGASGTDGIFACPERNGVRLLSQNVPTYAYEFNDENAYLVYDLFPSPPYYSISFPLGSSHFSEVPYLFDIFSTPSNFTLDQKLLSEAMISYWTQFAATGDPNSAGEQPWAPYNSTTDEFQSLVPPTPTVETTFNSDHQCDFWKTAY